MAARIWNKLIKIQEVAWMPQIDLHQIIGLASHIVKEPIQSRSSAQIVNQTPIWRVGDVQLFISRFGKNNPFLSDLKNFLYSTFPEDL